MATFSNIKRLTTGCGTPVVRFVAKTGCDIAYGINFGGSGKILASSGTPAQHVMVTNLRAKVYKVPRTLERQNSQHCRPQKSSSAQGYIVEGLDYYPEWKMTEIETMLLQSELVMDGFSLVYDGETPFAVLGTECTGLYRFRATMRECTQEKIFGCYGAIECLRKGLVFVIKQDPSGSGGFFNNFGLIAKNVPELLQWFSVQGGTLEVEEITDASTWPCAPYTAIKVLFDSQIGVESQFYAGRPAPANAVYGVLSDYDNPNAAELCNGVVANACDVITVGTVTYETISCDVITVGTVTFDTIGGGCPVELMGAWTGVPGDNTITSTDNRRTLNVLITNPDYIIPPAYNQVSYTHTIEAGEEGGFAAGLSAMVVNSVKKNGDWMDSNQWIYNQGTDILSGGLPFTIGDEIEYYYAAGIPDYPSFVREPIMVVEGSQCLPPVITYLRSALSGGTVSNMPEGGLLELNPNGIIYYTGSANSVTPAETKLGAWGVSWDL